MVGWSCCVTSQLLPYLLAAFHTLASSQASLHTSPLTTCNQQLNVPEPQPRPASAQNIKLLIWHVGDVSKSSAISDGNFVRTMAWSSMMTMRTMTRNATSAMSFMITIIPQTERLGHLTKQSQLTVVGSVKIWPLTIPTILLSIKSLLPRLDSKARMGLRGAIWKVLRGRRPASTLLKTCWRLSSNRRPPL